MNANATKTRRTAAPSIIWTAGKNETVIGTTKHNGAHRFTAMLGKYTVSLYDEAAPEHRQFIGSYPYQCAAFEAALFLMLDEAEAHDRDAGKVAALAAFKFYEVAI